MKINIINIETKENDFINFNNIFLSANNPRYTLIKSIENSIKELIIKGDYKNEKEVFKKLLKSEGDFLELKSLLESIIENGFNNEQEPIYLIKDKENYVVAEGNRRIMCLKLLSDNFSFPDYLFILNNEFKYQNNQDEYINWNEINYSKNSELENDELKKRLENYNDCCDILNKIKQKINEINVYVKILDNDNELWNEIYDKHLTGVRKGMRKWSRSKYFSDLLCILYENGINKSDEKIKKLIYLKFRRDDKYVISDFKEAQFIYSCFFYGKQNDIENENKEFYLDFEILDEMIFSDRISALERAHSYNKIIDFACKEILNISKDDFKNKYFEIKYDEINNKIKFNEKLIKANKFLKLIFKFWQDKKITTRQFDLEELETIKNDLFFLFNNYGDIKSTKTEQELDLINEFSLSIENIENLLQANKPFHKTYNFDRFQIAKDMKINNKKFIKEILKNLNLDSIEPIFVFENLLKQLKYVSKDFQTCLNAIACTTRSLIEQLYIWFSYYISKNKDIHIKNLASSNVNSLFKWENNRALVKSADISKCIEIILKTNLNQDKIDYYKARMKFYLLDNKSNLDNVNEFIHSNHRIYLDKNYNNNLQNLKDYHEFILDFFSNINFQNDLFKEINERIINYIKENN